jgi:hypothetical protein
MKRTVGGVLFLFLAVVGSVQADEPLPPPRSLPVEPVAPPVVIYPPLIHHRTSAYDVWQYYGVDRFGHFRPVVVDTPRGAFYLYNGQPYPWITIRPRSYMPYATD